MAGAGFEPRLLALPGRALDRLHPLLSALRALLLLGLPALLLVQVLPPGGTYRLVI